MSTHITQLVIALVIVTIFMLLWRSRHERFARIGNSWSYILTGFACLLYGEISNLVFRFLVEQGRASAGLSEPVIAAGHTMIILGLLLTAFGVHRWLSAVQELCIDSATVKKRNNDLHERLSADGKLLSTIPAALYRASGSRSDETTEIVFFNDVIKEILGYGAAEFEADPLLFYELLHDEDKKRYGSERSELWNNDGIVVEHRFRHRNGEYRWLRRHLNRLSDDIDGSTEWHGCAFDITDLKRAEARLTDFLEAAPDPVVTTNDKGEIVRVNAQAERLYGYSKKDLLGQPIFTLIPEETRDRHLARFPEYLTITTSRMIDVGAELHGRRKDGTEFPAEISVSPIETGDETLLAFAIRDVSDRKDIEAQLRQSQKMEAVGQLTGGIAHDFNNMLTVVIGNLQLIEQASKSDAATSRLTQAAMDAAMRAAELVRRLLAFSRQQLLAPRTTSINNLVTAIEPLICRTITPHVSMEIRLADDLWFARVDQSQLENTLLNLANNARDAMHTRSGGRLTIETTNVVLDETYAAQQREVTPGEYVMIAVSDNGEGIPSDVLPQVFDPFYSTKEIGKGSGLGLSMVYGFVKQSNGHIKVYSEEGHGTTIRIYIPRSKATHENSFTHTSRTKVVPNGDETILIVEDDQAVRDVAISLLTSLGYKVLHAECGSEALLLLAANQDIDLLFTDIVMPGGMTGTELAERAVAGKQNLKVLFTSGYTTTAVFANGLLEPSNDILNKPYQKEMLAQAVRDVLDREQQNE